LEKDLINDFVNDFNKSERIYTNKENIHLLDLIINTKDSKEIRLKSDGTCAFYNDSLILVNKKDLMLIYWKHEENAPWPQPPVPIIK